MNSNQFSIIFFETLYLHVHTHHTYTDHTHTDQRYSFFVVVVVYKSTNVFFVCVCMCMCDIHRNLPYRIKSIFSPHRLDHQSKKKKEEIFFQLKNSSIKTFFFQNLLNTKICESIDVMKTVKRDLNFFFAHAMSLYRSSSS